jgi:hypothetical protein
MLAVQNKCRKYSFGVDLGTRTRPAMALDGRFTGSFVRKLLQTKAHAASKPSPLEGVSRLSPKTRARLRTFHYYRWTIGQNFRSCGRRPIPLPPALVHHNHLHPCRNRAEAAKRVIGRTIARATETLRSTLSRTRYWITLSSMRSTSGTTLRFHCVHTIGERTQFAL